MIIKLQPIMSIFSTECVCVGGGGDGIGTRGIRPQTNPNHQELDRVPKPWGEKIGT